MVQYYELAAKLIMKPVLHFLERISPYKCENFLARDVPGVVSSDGLNPIASI